MEILLNNIALELGSKNTISKVLRSEFFNTLGSRSYPITIPASAVNCAALSFPNKLANTAKWVTDKEVYVRSGAYSFKALLDVTRTTEKTIDVLLKVGTSVFWSVVQDHSIQDLDHGSISMGKTQDDVLSYAFKSVTGGFPNDQCVFPTVDTPLWYGEVEPVEEGEEDNNTNSYFKGRVNNFVSSYVKNYIEVGGEEDVFHNKNSLVPCLFLFYVIRQLFGYWGYKVEDSPFWINQDFKRLVLWNSQSLDQFGEDDFVHVKHAGGHLFGQDIIAHNTTYSDELGLWDGEYYRPYITNTVTAKESIRVQFLANGNGGSHNQQGESETQWVTVKIMCNSTMLAFKDASGSPGEYKSIEIECEKSVTTSDKLWIYVHFHNGVAENSTGNIVESKFRVWGGTQGLNVHKKKFYLRDHLPDMQVNTFLQELATTFSLYYKIDEKNKSVSLNYIDDLINAAPVQELKGDVIEDSLKIIEAKESGFKYDYEWKDDPAYEDNFRSNESYKQVPEAQYYTSLPDAGIEYDGYLGRVRSDNAYYICKKEGNWKWVYWGSDCRPIKTPEGAIEHKEITSSFLPVLMKKHHVFSHFEGASAAFEQKGSGFSLHLMMWDNALGLPKAHSNTIHWKEWRKLRESEEHWELNRKREVEFQVVMSKLELKKLDINKAVMWRGYKLLIDELKVKLEEGEKVIANITGALV